MPAIITNCCQLTKEECDGNAYAPSFCHYCSERLQVNEPDPWLIPGWPYEVWNAGEYDNQKQLEGRNRRRAKC